MNKNLEHYNYNDYLSRLVIITKTLNLKTQIKHDK